MQKISNVDEYLKHGCLRCKYGATPQCKVHMWAELLSMLRDIALDCKLVEEIKWSVPCYTHKGKNVLVVSAFKSFGCISFFKGALMQDSHSLFAPHSESTQAGRVIRFRSISEVEEQSHILKKYIREAIAIEETGQKVVFKKNIESIPIELIEAFQKIPQLKHAFYNLSPGRQRGYIIYFSKAKQSTTRLARILKYTDKILAGAGLLE
jgi:uncharacterized protein YdeI (YjbR/CyaY-like superfamily)